MHNAPLVRFSAKENRRNFAPWNNNNKNNRQISTIKLKERKQDYEYRKEEKIEESITNNAVLDNITLETNDEELIKEQNKPSPIGNGVKPDIELVRSTLATTQNSNSIEDFVQTHKEAIITGGCSLGLFIVYLFVQRLRRKQCN